MLVLNTNSWNWWFTLTNENILMSYPDPKQILITPLWNIDVNWKLTIETVNWTPIHQIAWQFCFPQYYENVATESTYWRSWWYTTASISNNLTRIATPSWLEWGEIVWKTIVYPDVLWFAWVSWLEYKVWLLHTDWTITYIWDHVCNLTKRSPSYVPAGIHVSWSNYSPYDYWSSWWITQSTWVVASAWDRIIVEYIWSWWWSSWINGFCCCFWKPCTQNPQARIRFFQISIE